MIKFIFILIMHDITEMMVLSWLTSEDTYKRKRIKITGINLGDD